MLDTLKDKAWLRKRFALSRDRFVETLRWESEIASVCRPLYGLVSVGALMTTPGVAAVACGTQP